MPKSGPIFALLLLLLGALATRVSAQPVTLRIERSADQISVYRSDAAEPLVTQHARATDRPYLHPIRSPEGRGVLTEYRPEHHPHQTDLYWGLKELNGRDYFMGWREEHYRRVSSAVVRRSGEEVRWQVVYDLLGEAGRPVLTETHVWSMRHDGVHVLLDLEWTGEARQDVTLDQFYVGGLFLRMPWREGVEGDVVNAAGQRNGDAEGRRAMWTDVGIAVDGVEEMAHVALFDHPDNEGFPVAWRVDNELGVGPSRQILGPWSLRTGERTRARYRLVIYMGERNPVHLNRSWIDFASGR